MSEREMLICLIKQAEKEFSDTGKPVLDIEEYVADYLLENGVCVPLVNENDTVYIILLNKVILFEVIYVNLYQRQFFYKGIHGVNLSYTFKTDDIGKTVFLTREAAEKALAERSGEE